MQRQYHVQIVAVRHDLLKKMNVKPEELIDTRHNILGITDLHLDIIDKQNKILG